MLDTTITNVDMLIAHAGRFSTSDNNYSMHPSKTRFMTQSPKFYDEENKHSSKVMT